MRAYVVLAFTPIAIKFAQRLVPARGMNDFAIFKATHLFTDISRHCVVASRQAEHSWLSIPLQVLVTHREETSQHVHCSAAVREVA